MAFSLSLSRRDPSDARGRNRCSLVFLGPIALVNRFARDRARTAAAALADQMPAQLIQRDDLAGESLQDGGARHAAHYATILALRRRMSARGLDRAQSVRAVVTHAGHDYADCRRAVFLRHGMEQDVGGGAVAVHRRRVGKDGRSEEHTSELQSPCNLVCRLLLEKKKTR